MLLTTAISEITQKSHQIETKLQEALKRTSPTATTTIHISDDLDEICTIEITSVPIFDLCFSYQTAKYLSDNNADITSNTMSKLLSNLKDLRPNSMVLYERIFGAKFGTNLSMKLVVNDVISIDRNQG